MEAKFDISADTAALVEGLREDGEIDLDGMVSKLIPYALFRDAEVEAADLYFDDAWFDFGLEEIEEEVGRELTDREVREVIVAKIGSYLAGEYEIDVAYCSGISQGAAVHLECDLSPLSCRSIIEAGCREIDEIPLLEVYDEEEEEGGREVAVADIYFCPGAEPEDLSDLLKVVDIPEAHSYDYIVPEEEYSEEEEE